MQNVSKFQLATIGIFAVFIIVGVFVFAFLKGQTEPQAPVTVWGVLNSEIFDEFVQATSLGKDRSIRISYLQKSESDLSHDFVEALASGVGPDLVFATHEFILEQRNKLFGFSFETFSERAYRDAYIEAAEVFVFPDRIIAIPVAVDPLVMYWNRDIFTNAGIPTPPTNWADFYNLSQKLTRKDGALNITQSAVALGEYRNIKNAKEIISTLILQAGNPITARLQSGNASVLSENPLDKPAPPAQSALSFYTEFSNPIKPFYSWNRSLSNSQDMFLSGDLAIYFGFASELGLLKLKNPNLNFDLTLTPQAQSGERHTTFARLYAFAIPRNSLNSSGAFKVAFTMSDQIGQKIAQTLKIAPARRAQIAQRPVGDPNAEIFYDSALFSKVWLDPGPKDTALIFQEMIESITGGRARVQEAIQKASTEINDLFRR